MGRASSPSATTSTKPQINFLRGWPAGSLLPAGLLREASSHILQQPDIYIPGLEYGPDPGDLRARKAVAAWLQDFYQPNKAINYERITMTGGASQSMGVILAALTDPLYTRAAWLVAPCYYLAFQIFQDAGFAAQDDHCRGVPEDEEGINVDWLKQQLVVCDREHEAALQKDPNGKQSFKYGYTKLFRHVIYVVPSFSNPSSRTMSLARREALVKVAREHDALIICDDVYDMLHWKAEGNVNPVNRARYPRLVDVDAALDQDDRHHEAKSFGNVISNGSFSKICGPGVRCGWVESSEKLAYLVSQAGVQRSGGAPSQLTSTYMAELVASGQLTQHITKTLQPAYAHRYGVIRKAITDHLEPLGVRLTQPDKDVAGGYFLWLQLPVSVAGAELARRALKEENVVVANGEMFELPAQLEQRQGATRFPHAFRVCFAWEDESKLIEGIQRLKDVIERMAAQGKQST